MRQLTVVGLIAVTAVATVHLTRTPSWASATTCLTGTDPAVAGDLSQITAVRALIDSICVCADFDGTPGKTNGKYVACAAAVVNTQAGVGQLRTQCKGTVKKYYSKSTCGVPPSKGVVPCIKKTVAGKMSCSIKPAARCGGSGQVACPAFTTCIDAADTNHDGLIAAPGDSGLCASVPTPTPTATPTPCPGRFCDNGDGTITDKQTGLMWEKKDQAGGVHDYVTGYSWAGLCGCTTGSCAGTEPLCLPNAAAASACSAATGSAMLCSQCSVGSCNVTWGVGQATTTMWDWLVQLNGSNFAGHNDWRIPTVGRDGGTAQLETILDTGVSGCGSTLPTPCVPAVFHTGCTPGCAVTGCSCTGSGPYRSATTPADNPRDTWIVNFSNGIVGHGGSNKQYGEFVRAVRGP